MTKKEFAKVMKMDEMDRYAFFARMLENEPNVSCMRYALNRIDDKAFDWAMDLDCSDEWMGIYSGLVCVCDTLDHLEDEDWDWDEDDDW